MNEEIGSVMRAIGRELAAASQSHSSALLTGVKVRIARLGAGVDSRAAQAEPNGYRLGAAIALSSVLAGLEDRLPSPSALKVLNRLHRPEILCTIASVPGLTQKPMADRLNLAESALSRYVNELAHEGFLEPAVALDGPGKAWSLTPWGRRTFLRLLDSDCLRRVPTADLSNAVIALTSVDGASLSAEPYTTADQRMTARPRLGVRTELRPQVQNRYPVDGEYTLMGSRTQVSNEIAPYAATIDSEIHDIIRKSAWLALGNEKYAYHVTGLATPKRFGLGVARPRSRITRSLPKGEALVDLAS